MFKFDEFVKRAVEKKLLFRNGRKDEGVFFTYHFKDQEISGSYNTTKVLDLLFLIRTKFPFSEILEVLLGLTAPRREALSYEGEIVWREVIKNKKNKNPSNRISLLEYLIKKEGEDLRDEHRFILDYL